MPVLVLFLCLIGNYYTYHSKGDLVQVEQEIYFESEIISTPVPDSGYVEKVYFNTNLSVEEVVAILSSLETNENNAGFILVSEDSSKIIGFMYLEGTYAILDAVTEEFYFMSNDLGYGFVGWNTAISYPLIINNNVVNSFQMEGNNYVSGTQNDKLIDLFSITPFEFIPGGSRIETKYLTFEEYIGKEKVNLSFFDITLLQTDNTFIKFQLPFLRNAFESVFNILEFESSYVSSFVLTSFTWMIQLLLLHVVVDTLAFIFKMYHKLMDKVV